MTVKFSTSSSCLKLVLATSLYVLEWNISSTKHATPNEKRNLRRKYDRYQLKVLDSHDLAMWRLKVNIWRGSTSLISPWA